MQLNARVAYRPRFLCASAKRRVATKGCACKVRRRRALKLRATIDNRAMLNGSPFERPRDFYARARDLMVNGFDLIEELSEVTIEPAEKSEMPTDASRVETVAYFGSPGAFCEEAARKLYPTAHLRPVTSWGGTIDDLLRGDADRALVPIENYITKRTRILYDLICRYDLHIVDEVFLNIEHALLAKPSARKEDIKVIASHIQALFQCERFVTEHFPEARLERLNDTAVAARMVAEYPTNELAAIGSRGCADTYGLTVLQDSIQDRPDNVTRFAVLGRQSNPPAPSEKAKTSILFALPNDKGSGTLGKALEIFGAHGINLLWLDSRDMHSPAMEEKHPAWNYLFYINLEGSVTQPDVKAALAELEEICLFFRVIGSYRMQARYLEDYVAT